MTNEALRAKILDLAAQVPDSDTDASEEAALAALAEMRGTIDELIRDRVGRSRSLGKSWALIGSALAMTRQAAHERFSA